MQHFKFKNSRIGEFDFDDTNRLLTIFRKSRHFVLKIVTFRSKWRYFFLGVKVSGKNDSSHTWRIKSKWCPPKLTNNPLLNEDDLESVEDYEEKVIYVRTKKVGYLIGTSGRTIRGFETNSGAKIDILKPNSQYVVQDLYNWVKFRPKDTHIVKV